MFKMASIQPKPIAKLQIHKQILC